VVSSPNRGNGVVYRINHREKHMRSYTLTKHNIFPRRVDKQIPVLGTDGASALVNFVLGERIFEGYGETDGAAVAVCFVSCWFGSWSCVRCELLE
jgi:hypothetical protein